MAGFCAIPREYNFSAEQACISERIFQSIKNMLIFFVLADVEKGMYEVGKEKRADPVFECGALVEISSIKY